MSVEWRLNRRCSLGTWELNEQMQVKQAAWVVLSLGPQMWSLSLYKWENAASGAVFRLYETGDKAAEHIYEQVPDCPGHGPPLGTPRITWAHLAFCDAPFSYCPPLQKLADFTLCPQNRRCANPFDFSQRSKKEMMLA